MSKANKRERQRQNREQRREYEAQLAKRRKAWKTARTFALIALPVIAIGVVLNLTGGDDSTDVASGNGSACTKVDLPAPGEDGTLEAPPLTIDPALTYVADVETSCGAFTITLDAAQAPQTVNSFVTLARAGFYDGLPFHRVVEDFVVQGGDPKGDGTGGPGYTLPDEPPANGYEKGSVAMANSGPGTSGSQFFVVSSADGADTLGGPPYLYSILGEVTSGIRTIDAMNQLASTQADGQDQSPKRPIVITSITIVESAPATP
ncbi:MAG: peptidylprolyl isomerase [Acidimicrobiia bacterium]